MIDNRNEKLQTESITIKKNYKTWFRKKANIILMCSTIGIGIVATAISVPLVFLNKFDFVVPVSNVRLSEVKNVYNKKTNEVTLIITGDNLSDNKDLYSIYNITNSRTNVEIPRADMTIIPYSNSRIDIKFQDRLLNDLSIYQVLFNNGTSSGIKIESTSNENIAQPIILLNSKPLDTTLSNGQQRERLAIDVSVENKIRGIEPSYQWFSSDTNEVNSIWTSIKGATGSIYEYLTPANIIAKKYFKCEVSYEYADVFTTDPFFVEKIETPKIIINDQPRDVKLSILNTSTTLAISASISGEVNSPDLSYQWYKADTNLENTVWESIAGATNSSNEFNINFIGIKFFKCKVSYLDLKFLDSEVVSIERTGKPVINITTQPLSVTLKHENTSTTLAVGAKVTNPIDGESLSYKWYKADVETGPWSLIPNANSQSLEYNVQGLIGKKYFKSEISYREAEIVTSDIAYIEKSLTPVISITQQPSSVTIPFSQQNTTLSISASVTNEITNQSLNYQWFISDTNDAHASWSAIPGAINANYVYDAITQDSIKYFKCEVRYKDAPLVSSNIVFVNRATAPVISITSQPSNVILPFGTDTTTLTIGGSITNGESGQSISYQWYDSNTSDPSGTWTSIPGAISSSYLYDATNLIGKKYFKCTISTQFIPPLDSNIVFVEKIPAPTLNITSQPTDTTLPFVESTKTLTVAAAITDSIAGQSLSYQWFTSDTAVENGTWTAIVDATNPSYQYDVGDFFEKKYFKCVISYQHANSVTSNIVFVQRTPAPVISITSQPTDVLLPFEQRSANLSVVTSIANSVSGTNPSYQWYESDTSDANGTWALISSATSANYTYDATNLVGKRYFKCEIRYANAATITSNIVNVNRTSQAIVTINSHPENKTLISSSTNPTLSVDASVSNPISGRPNPIYQWYKSIGTSNTWTSINGATNSTYIVDIGTTDKNSWRDTWYKCEVSYAGAANPTVISNPSLVKMTLTAVEAKVELLKWLSIDANVERILNQYFGASDARTLSGSNAFFSSLWTNKFHTIPNTNVVSITPEQMTSEVSQPYKSYKIKLITNNIGHYIVKSTSGNPRPTTIPIGSFIEFNTLFSFTSDINLNLENGAKYDMNMAPIFSTGFTELKWTSTMTAPDASNGYKNGAYPVRVLAADGSIIFTDSVFLPARMEFIDNKDYTFIPTYNII
ncbi:MAG: hypothetical protein RSC65_02500 [Malacoplasma sp.]